MSDILASVPCACVCLPAGVVLCSITRALEGGFCLALKISVSRAWSLLTLAKFASKIQLSISWISSRIADLPQSLLRFGSVPETPSAFLGSGRLAELSPGRRDLRDLWDLQLGRRGSIESIAPESKRQLLPFRLVAGFWSRERDELGHLRGYCYNRTVGSHAVRVCNLVSLRLF